MSRSDLALLGWCIVGGTAGTFVAVSILLMFPGITGIGAIAVIRQAIGLVEAA